MPWQPSYATAAELAARLGVPNTDAELAMAIEAASRAIDRYAGRQFGLLSSSEFRWFPAEYFRGTWIIDIDDLMTTTGLTVETVDAAGNPVAEVTEYRLTPRNAASVGRPWTRLEILAGSPVKPDRHGVQVTARWGWSAVPESVKLATLIQAAKIYDRKRNIGGPLTSERIDDVAYTYGQSTELDADAAGMVAPFRKPPWAAV